MKKATFVVFMLAMACMVSFSSQAQRVIVDNNLACQKLHAKEYKAAKKTGYLSASHALEISENYYSEQKLQARALNKKGEEAEETKAVWYSLEALKKYIWQIEETMCKSGCDVGELGVHFYFAKYPKDPSKLKEMGVPAKYADRQTIFLSATYRSGDVNVDFDPYQASTVKNCKPRSLKQAILDTRAGLMYNKVKGDDGNIANEEPGVLNHGDLIPPPFGTGTFPAESKDKE